MYSCSDAFEQAAASPVTEAAMSLMIGTTAFGPSSISSLTVNRKLGSGTYAIGDVACAQMQVVILTSELPNAFEAMDFVPSLGFVVNGANELIPQGRFRITEGCVADGGLFTTITAYDSLYFLNMELDVEVDASKPREAMEALSQKYGFDVDLSTIPLVGYGIARVGNSVRDAISAIAAGCWRNAVTDGQGRVCFKKPSGNDGAPHFDFGPFDMAGDGLSVDPGTGVSFGKVTCEFTWYSEEEVEPEQIAPQDDGEDGGEDEPEPITETVDHRERFVYPSADPQDVAGVGVSPELLVTSYSTETEAQALREAFYAFAGTADDLGSRMRGYVLSVHGRPQMEVGDVAVATDNYGREFTLPIMEVTQSYNGAIITTASCTVSDAYSVGWVSEPTLTQTVAAVKSDTARYKKVVTGQLEAQNAVISNLKVEVANVETMVAEYAKVGFIEGDDAEFKSAQVFGLLEAGSVVTDDVSAVSGSFTKMLTGVLIKGDIIDANTITADKIIIRDRDTNSGVLWEINNGVVVQDGLDEETLKRMTLDGKVLTVDSVTADKISVTDLAAFRAKLADFVIDRVPLVNEDGTEVVDENGDPVYQYGYFKSTNGKVYMDSTGKWHFGSDGTIGNESEYHIEFDVDGTAGVFFKFGDRIIGSFQNNGEQDSMMRVSNAEMLPRSGFWDRTEKSKHVDVGCVRYINRKNGNTSIALKPSQAV